MTCKLKIELLSHVYDARLTVEFPLRFFRQPVYLALFSCQISKKYLCDICKPKTHSENYYKLHAFCEVLCCSRIIFTRMCK